MDRRIKFRHLETLSAIAREGSLSRAAAQLNLSGPAVSKTLKELEDILDTRLMTRSRSGVFLTAEGEIFLQFAEQSTAALQHGLRSLKGGGMGRDPLRIGILPSVAGTLIPRAVAQVARDLPGLLLELHEGFHDTLTARLRSGHLDLVVGRLGRPASMQGLRFEQLYSEEVILVARPDSPARQVAGFADLAPFRVIYPPENSAIRPLVARLLIAHGVPLFPNRVETASPSFGRAVTLSDPGVVWVISKGVVATDLAQGVLARLDLDTTPTLGPVGVISRSAELSGVAARHVTRALARAAAQS